MKELVGLKILDVEIGGQEGFLRFITDIVPVVYSTYGDCCSETWFSEIMRIDNLINHTVSEVKELYLPQYQDDKGRQEVDRIYGFSIATEAGHATIVFRNSSNGYYGGSCDLDQGRSKTVTDWISLKHLEDWTAYENTGMSYYKFLKLKAFF
jgi:hypothetical protein